jgi:hypothetical protein
MSKMRYATDATTMREAESSFENEGFTGQFAPAEGGAVTCFTCHTTSPSSAVELTALVRVEGASDPDDMAAVAAVLCPNCGARGTLIMKYGPESTMEESDTLRLLEDRRQSEAGGTLPRVEG